MSTTTDPVAPAELLVPDLTTAPPGRLAANPTRDVAVVVGWCYAAALALALFVPATVEDPGLVSGLTLVVPATVLGIRWVLRRLRGAPANPVPFGLRRAGFRAWPAAVAVPALCVVPPIALLWALGVVSFHELGLYLADMPVSLALMSVLVLGEELGWRGFVLPRLARVLPVRRASLVTGFLQGLFHLPLLLLTPVYDGDGRRWIVVPCAVLVITVGGVLFGWLRTRFASVWPAAIAHAAVNTFLVEAPTLVTDDPSLAAHLSGEGGVLTALLVLAVAVVLLRADWTPRVAER